MNKKNKKLIIVLCAVLAVLIAAAAIIYANFGPNAQAKKENTTVSVQSADSQTAPDALTSAPSTEKTEISVTVKVVTDDGEKSFDLKTTGKTLGDALLDNKLAEGSTSQYGLFITTVNGVTADDTKQQWWCITKNGESVTTGADTTYIKNGEQYEITLKTGYDEF